MPLVRRFTRACSGAVIRWCCSSRLRAELHARYTSRWHDWASLVVYEALPQALGEQLDAVAVLPVAGVPSMPRWSGSTWPCERAASSDESAAAIRSHELDEAVQARGRAASARAALTPSNASACAPVRASGWRRRPSRWRRRHRRTAEPGRRTPTTLLDEACARLRSRGARFAGQRRARRCSGSRRCIGFWCRSSRCPRPGQGPRSRAAGKRRSFAPTCTASIPTPKSAPGRTAASRSCGSLRLADVRTSMDDRRTAARIGDRMFSCAGAGAHVSVARRVSGHLDAGGSSRATSTGGASRASSRISLAHGFERERDGAASSA